MSRFNARQAWDALDADQQRAVGEAALLLQLSTEAQAIALDEGPNLTPALKLWERTEQIAWRLLEGVVPIDADLFPDGPDLAALGIRACRECGCTDDNACPGGCSWVETDLCSACAPTDSAEDEPQLGPCCMCDTRQGVHNLIMLDRRCEIPGHGWGCVVCGLPADGAYAVLCDPCREIWQADHSQMLFACRGYPASEGRIAIAELPPGEFKHRDIDHG